MKNPHMFQSVLIALCLLVSVPSFSKENSIHFKIGLSNFDKKINNSRLNDFSISSEIVNGLANPIITTQPESTKAACVGNTVTFSVTATGTGTLTYSWKKNGILLVDGGNVSGATTATLTLINVSSSDANSYTCDITDDNGGVSSNSSTLAVNALPVLTKSGNTTICSGQSTTLSISGANSYLWNTSSTATFITVNPTSNTTYSVTGTDSNGCTKTETFTVQVNPLPTIVISGNTTICNGTPTTLTASGATTYLWNTGSNLNPITISPNSNTVYTVTGTDTNGCINTKSSQVVVNVIPSASVSATSPICSGNTAVFTIYGTPNATVVYKIGSGSNVNVVLDGSGIAVINVSSATSDQTLNLVSVTLSGCQNTSFATPSATIVVNSIPSAPITSAVSYCQNDTAVSLTATPSLGGTLNWYITATGGNSTSIAPTPSTTTAGTATYYVSQTISGCEGPRTPLAVTVKPLPGLPAVISPINYCVGETPSALSATGTALQWYTVASSGTASTSAPTPNTSIATELNYFVSQIVNGCEGPRANSKVIVNAIPANPSATNFITYCQNQIVSPLIASGSSLKWYTTALGGTGSITAPTPSTTNGGTSSYYVSQTINGCESGRTQIDVLVNPTPLAPTVTSPLTYCLNETAPVLSTATVTGNTLKWYTSSSGGTGSLSSPTPSTASSGTTSYYVSETNTYGCESPRSLISVTVNSLPLAPTVTPSVSYCKDATASTLTASPSAGHTLRWYTVATGGTATTTAITPSTNTVGSITYYVSQVNTTTGCESARASIDVTVKAIPSIPTYTSPIAICQFTPATSLSAMPSVGGTINWYTTATGGIGFTTAPTPSTTTVGTTTYFLSQTINGCESARGSFAVTVNPTPATPTISSVVNPTCASPSGSLQLNNLPTTSWTVIRTPAVVSGTEIYNNSTSTYSITNLEPGTYSFTVSNGLCTSTSSTSVTINAVPVQSAPIVGTIVQPTCTVSTGSVTLNNLPSGNWTLTSNSGATISGSGSSTVISGLIPGTYSYTVKNILTDCISVASSNVVIAAQPFTPSAPAVVSPQFFVTGAKVSDLQAPSGTIKWYSAPNGGTALNPLTTLVSGNYYASETLGSCESSRTSAAITVDSPTNGGIVNAVGTSTLCSGGSAMLKLTGYVGSILRWESSPVSNFASNVISITNTTDSYTAANLTTSLFYRAVVQSGVSTVENSLPALITVDVPSNAGTLSPLTSEICKNTSGGTITLTGNNGVVTKWQESTNGGSSWIDVAGTANLNSYVVPALSMTTSFRAVVQNGVCTQVATTVPSTITVKDTPVIPLLTNQLACLGETKVFGTTPQNSAYNYEWTSNRRTLTNNLLSTISILFDQAYQEDITLTISPKDPSNTCIVSGTFTVSTNPLPAAAVISGATICEGNTIAIGANSVTGSTYSWSSMPAGFSSTSSNPIVSPSTSTTYSLEQTILATGCKKSSDVIVTVQKKPLISITDAPEITICETTSNQLVSAQIDNPFSSFEWEIIPTGAGSLIDATTLNPQFTPSSIGIANGYAILRLKVTGSNACSGVVTKDLKINITKQSIANAGSDVTTCGTNLVQIDGSHTQNATSLNWSILTNGITGVLDSSNPFKPTFTPSLADINYSGPIDIRLVASSGTGCITNSDTVSILITKPPLVDAGSATATICEGTTYSISTPASSASNIVLGSLNWTTGGDGRFSNLHDLNTVYTPGSGDIAAGFAVLTLTGTGNSPCFTPATDTVILSIVKKPTATLGVDKIVCEGPVNIYSNIQNAGSIKWLINGGSGSFVDATVSSPIYNPDPILDKDKSITFTVEVTPSNSCGPVVTDSVIYKVNANPVVIAGGNSTICETQPTFNVTSTIQYTDSVVWTSTGSGSFDNANAEDPIYTFSPGDIAVGSVTFTITGKKFGCPDVTDTMTVTIRKNPITNITSVNSICQGETVFFTATAPNSSSVNWTKDSGSGTINNSNTLFASYVSNPNESGTINFRIEAQAISPCNIPSNFFKTVTVVAKPTAEAGDSATICEGEDYTIGSTASASNYSGLNWTSSGSGIFIGGSTLNPIYRPSLSDINLGSVRLKLTAVKNQPCFSDAVDEMILTINKKPVITVVNSSLDVCTGSGVAVPISGPDADVVFGIQATNYDDLEWSTSGNGPFTNELPANLTTPNSYTPTAADIASGSVILTLKASRTALNCNSFTTQAITLNFIKGPQIDAGPATATICENGSYTTSSATAADYKNLIWSSNGTGTFSNNTSLKTAVYTPSMADTTRGSITLTLTAIGNSCNAPTTDNIILSFHKLPQITVPNDTAICESSTSYAISGANVIDGGALSWTSDGIGGRFSDTTILNPTYFPSAQDVTRGFVNLTLTAAATAECSTPKSKSFKITFVKLPTVNAGPDMNTCDLSFTVLNATAANYSAIQWTANGTGSLEPSSIDKLEAIYNPLTAQTGSVTLTLTVTPLAACLSTGTISDAMQATFIAKPTITTIPQADICADSPNTTILGTTIANDLSYEWTSTTGTTIINKNVLEPAIIASTTDISNGFIDLTITATPNAPCVNTVSRNVRVEIKPLATVTVTNDLTVCMIDANNDGQLDPKTLSATFTNRNTADASSILWEIISGNGRLEDVTSETPKFYPAPDTDAVIVRVSVKNVAPCAGVEFKEFTLKAVQKPVVTLSKTTDTVCSSALTYNLAGNTILDPTNRVEWTRVAPIGTGNFANPTTANTTYTFSDEDRTNGFVELLLTAYADPSCSNLKTSEKITIFIDKAPTATISSALTVCAGEPYTATAVNPDGNTLAWTEINGNHGTFVNANLATATFNQSLNNSSNFDIQLTSTTTAACAPKVVTQTITVQPKPTIDAGASDQYNCSSQPFVISGVTGTNYDSVLWTVDGTSSSVGFSNPTDMNPTFTPTQTQINAGQIVLRVTAKAKSPCGTTFDVWDTITLHFTPIQTVSFIAPTSICEGDTISLVGSAPNSVSVAWSTSSTSSTTGFTNPTGLNSVYTPSALDLSLEKVTLTLTGVTNSNCPTVTESIEVVIKKKPTANAGAPVSLCQGMVNYQVNDATAANFDASVPTNINWTLTGPATILSGTQNQLNPIIVPTAGVSGQIVLTLTVTGYSECNITAVSTKTITIVPPPVVTVPSTKTICEGATLALTTAEVSATNAGAVSWSSSLGTFSPSNSLATVYTPAAGQTGLVNLDLTVNGVGGVCSSVTRSIALTIIPKPIVNAGVDGTICQTGTFTVSGASVQNAASYSWGVSGPATIQSGTENSLNPVIVPIVGAFGNVTVTLTAVGVGVCPTPISDSLVLLINPTPVVNAGADAILCQGTASYQLNGSVTNAASGTTYTWTTNGSGTIQATADPLKPVYVPGGNDFNSITGTKVIRFDLKATSTNGCAPVTDFMELTIYAKPVVNAGSDITNICEGTAVTLDATAINSNLISWSTSGNGTFDLTSNTIKPTYTLGTNDTSSVTLTISAMPNAACPQVAVTDAMTIFINKKPTIVASTNEFTMCAETFTLPDLVTVSDASSILWTNTTGASGTPGVVSNATTETPSFTPSAGEIVNGFVLLKVTAQPKINCSVTPEVATTIKVILIPKVTVDAGDNKEFCQGSPVIIDNGATTSATNYYWTENGSGTIKASTINTLHPEYTPVANETGTITLTLHALNPSPCTGEVLDTMTVTIQSSPIVNAGPDFTVCAGSNASLVDATSSHSDTIVWSNSQNSNGTSNTGYVGGTFIGIGINKTYVPSQNDKDLGYVYLTVKASNSSCTGFVTDVVKVTIAPGTSVSAGANGTICEGATFNLSSATSNATTVAWTSSQNSDGTSSSTYNPGQFVPSNSINSIYTPSNDDISRGYVFLTITGTGNITCPVNNSTIRLEIVKKPTVSASDIQMCMSNTAGVVLNGTGANYATLNWSKISGPASGYINNGRYFTGLPLSTPTNEVAKLRLVATPLSGCTVDAVTEITVNIQALPIVEAGSNGATCYIPGQPIAPFSIIGSSVANASSSTWTTSGLASGIFNVGTPVIYQSYSNSCNPETLTLTANGIGACSSTTVSDAVILAVNCTPPSLGIIGGNTTVCQGTSSVVYTVAIDSNVQTYNWQVPTGATIVSGQGTNSISVDYGTNAISGTISVNGINGCGSGISSTLAVTVNQRPSSTTITGPQTLCIGTSYTFTANLIANADSYEWKLSNGSTVISTFSTPNNTLTIPATVSGNLSVQGFSTTCGLGDASANHTITVVPLPILNSGLPADICSNTVFNYIPSSATIGVTFTWTRALQSGISNPAASGTGVINETLLNTTNALVPVNYTITTTNTNGCSKSEIVTVRVKPIPSLTSAAPVAAICSGTVFEYEPTSDATGAIVWSRATVAGISETGISGSTATNSKISETLTNTTLSPITVSYVLNLPAINGCTGPSKIINLIVNPSPNVTSQSSQVLCEGDALGINFATTNIGGTSTFNWTNSNTNIGLDAIGSGSVPTFTLLNTSTVNQVAHISVTPMFTNGGISCSGSSQTFDITVNPTADVNQPSDQVICNGSTTTAIVFSTTNTTGTTTYSWTNDNTSIGLGSTGNGTITPFIVTNATAIPQIATIVVTPTYTSGGVSCVGLPKTFRITVNPTANVVQPSSSVVCANSLVNSIFATTNTVGTTTYSWTNDTTSIGLAASGNGSITPPFIALNSGAIPVVATINVTPTYTNAGLACTGAVKTFTITVNPAAQVNSVSDITKCKGDSVSAINFSTTNTIGTTTYAWTNSNPSIGLGVSGSGDIPTFIALNSGTAPAIATITVTPTFTNNGVSCTGPVKVFTITVNPTADMIQPVSKVVCNGETTSVNFATTNTGTTTYSWSSDIAIGMSTLSSTGSIANFTATNSGNSPIVATITVTPTYTNNGVSCVGLPKTFTITVNPSADVNQPVTPLVLCNGTPTSVNFTTNNIGGTTTYSWTNNSPSIGISSSGIGSINTFPVSNLGTTPLTANLTVTPTFANAGKTCTGATKNFVITINPTAQVNQPNSQVRCNGEAITPIGFSTQNTVGTTTYSWTNDTPGIGLNASGTGDITAFNPVNLGTTPITATIVVTPSYTNGGVVCTGPTKTFTITVNPVANVSQPTSLILCNGVQTNVNFTTANSGGVTSYSWTNDTSSIGLNATGFGSIPNFTVVNNGNTQVVANFVVTPIFSNAGKSCSGTTKIFTITVNPTAQVVQPASEVICNGGSTTTVNFATTYTSGVTTFAWTNSNTSIGLSASGTGSIPSFTGTNLGTTPQVATIVVTPTYTEAGVSCTGPSKTFTITVNPTAQVNQPTAQVICNGDTYSLNFSSLNTGGTTTYSWTNNNTAIGLNVATGVGSIPSFTAVNTGLAPTVATITVTPTYTNGGVSCVGLPKSFTITVNPTADVIQPTNQVVCNGVSTAGITFSSLNNSGTTTYSWTNSNANIGLGLNGSGAVIPAFNAVNTGNIPIVATITVTPSYTNAGVVCTGPSKTFTITVNPTAELIQPTNQIVCNGASTTLVNFISNNLGGATSYTWVNNNTTIGLASNGAINIPSFNAVNTGTTPVVATIVVTPTFSNAGQTCAGPTKSFTITVNPSAEVVQPIATTLCNGDTSNVINFTSLNSVGTTTYTWTNTNTSIGLGLNGLVSIPSFTAINTSTSPITSTVTVTPVYTNGGLSCSGSNKTFAITVNPSAGFNQPVSQELCSGATTTAVSFTTVNTGGTTTYSWTNSNPSIGIPASGSGAIPAYTVVNSGATPQVATITITATYSNAGKSCTTAKSFTITVYPSPKATISSTNSFIVCQNDVPPSVTFTGSNGTPPFLFTYSIGTNNYTVSSSGTSNSATVSLPTVNSGNYTVTLLSVQDSSTTACTSTTIISPNQAFVTVQEQGTIIPVSSSTVTQTECQGNSIIPIVFTIGGSATSAYVTNLPAGLTGLYDISTHKFTISGSPTATGIFNYVIHTAGSTNGCNSTYGGTLTVKADDVITALTPTTTNQSVCATAPIQSISYNLGGGATGGDVTFSPHQPNGIVWSVASNVLTISGATNEVGVFTYTVQSYGICDQTTYSGTIEIKENATVRVVSGNPNPTVCINNSLGTALQYGIMTTTSATMVHSGTLPTGVSFNATTGSFSGVPTQSGSFPYTISSSTGCGNVLSGVISVNPAQSIADVSGNTSQINSCVNSAIDPILFKVASGVTSIIVSPALPAGITYSLDANNIVTISGTPTSATTSTSTFTLTTQGSCGSVATATITFDIKPAATITFISSASSLNQSVCQNGPIVPIQFTIGGGASGILQPILPTGLTIARDGSGVYTISGNPTANGTFTIPITTTGCPVTQTITITNINSVVSISLTSATGTDNQTQCQSASNSAIVPIKYATVGTTGVIVSGLPTGVTSSFNVVTGELTISGTPTKAGIFNYTITTLPCNIVKTGVLKVSTPISISNESVKNVTCSTASNGEISVTIVGGVTSGGFYAVHWSGPNGFQQNQTNIIGLEAGNYTISGTDAVGCPLPTKTYTVLPALPITISLVSTTNVTCNNALGCVNFNYTGGTGIYTHFDLEYLDSSSQMWNVVPNPNNNYFNICNLKAGLYRIAVTDSNSCKTEPYVFTIYDYSTLKIAAVSLDETLCANTAGKVRVTVSSLDNNLTFYYNSVVVPSVDLGNHVFELSIASPTTPSGIIKVTNSQNCWDTTTVNTSLVDPKLNFTSINLTTYGNVSVNESVKFTNGLTSANIPAEYDHIVWDFGDNSPYKVFYNPEDINPNSSGESITTVFHTYAIDGLYPVTLTVYNKFGCSRSITEILTVGQGAGIMLPTAFSPNNDGINDLFRPSLLGLKEVSMYIYDNWGNLIYEVSSDTASLPTDWGWNGIEKVNSEPKNGNYRYYIMAKTINDKIIEKEGQFMLIK